MASFGRTSCGWRGADFYRASISEFARDADKARQSNHIHALADPLPGGRPFDMVKSQLLIEPGIDEFPDFKACLGCIESITEASRKDTSIPLCPHAILRLPFKYGASEGEYKRRWAYYWVSAFSSKCIFCCVSALVLVLIFLLFSGDSPTAALRIRSKILR